MADVTPHWTPGDSITGHAGATITGGRFVTVSGTPTEGNPTVSPAGAGVAALGVAGRDKASGEKVPVIRQGVVPVTAGGTVTAGERVQSDATGRAITLAAGVALGMALSSATVGNDVQVALNLA